MANFIAQFQLKTERHQEDIHEDRWEECTTGIHFFMQKEDAIKFYF